MALSVEPRSVIVSVCACARVSVRTCACARPRVSAAWPGRPLVHNRSSVFRAGEPGREVAPRQAPAALDSRQLRFPHGLRQLLQGRAPRPRRHPRGAAPPAAAREHLAAPQGPAAPEAAALCFPAGRSAGGSRAALVRRGAICRWSPGARPSHRRASLCCWRGRKTKVGGRRPLTSSCAGNASDDPGP